MRTSLALAAGLLLAAPALDCRADPLPCEGTPDTRFPLINPMLPPPEADNDLRELRPFRLLLEKFEKDREGKDGVEHITLYFRDLWNGPWFGVSEGEPFAPSSMLKLPILISFLRQVQDEPKLLEGKARVKAGEGQPLYHREGSILKDGEEYTASELLEQLIVRSDNRAIDPLMSLMDEKVRYESYFDLGLLIPIMRSAELTVTVKQYGSLFRILYNASYLDRATSQKALDLLTRAAYKDGILRGVPPGIPVAHKFGEAYDPKTDLSQLHECGIVYHPGRHYLLCVMTRGKDYAALADVVADASRLVYEEVTRQLPAKKKADEK